MSSVTRVGAPPIELVRHPWAAWLPLVLLPAAVCVVRGRLEPWRFMGLLSIAIFCGCKWQTCRREFYAPPKK
ncbi:MAG TPA: hypothetical protein VEJ67_04700 [Candidatus Cybelea sp.]|nr:hypothetical protein [Candidatus Cybelea sp.]